MYATSFLTQQPVAESRDRVPDGTQVVYVCDDQYKIQGPSKLDCVDGKWPGQLPQCVRIPTCPHPETIKNGFFDVSGPPRERNSDGTLQYEENTKIFYICVEGYKLMGNEHRVCQGGTWVGVVPSCIPLGCSRPSAIPNGGFNLFSHNDTSGVYIPENSQVYYYCHNGFKLSQDQVSPKLVCKNGQWIGEIPSCCKYNS